MDYGFRVLVLNFRLSDLGLRLNVEVHRKKQTLLKKIQFASKL